MIQMSFSLQFPTDRAQLLVFRLLCLQRLHDARGLLVTCAAHLSLLLSVETKKNYQNFKNKNGKYYFRKFKNRKNIFKE